MSNLVKQGRAKRVPDAEAVRNAGKKNDPVPTRAQLAYLRRGLGQPGGKLPLFDENGLKFHQRTIRACIANGWSEPWFSNPSKPDWQVCKLTPLGEEVVRRS